MRQVATLSNNLCTGKGFVFLLVFCVLFPLSGFSKKFIPDYNRQKPITVSCKDSSVVISTKKEGVSRLRTERFYWYYFQGKVARSQGTYLGRVLEGEYLCLDSQGFLAEKGFFRNGLKHGEWKTWYRNGSLKSEQSWRRGKQANLRFEYGPNGEKEKYVLRKGKWELKAKPGEKIKSTPAKKKKLNLRFWKKKEPATALPNDSLPKGNEKPLKRKKKTDAGAVPSSKLESPAAMQGAATLPPASAKAAAKSDRQTPVEYLREHMPEYDKAQKEEKAASGKKGRPKEQVKASEKKTDTGNTKSKVEDKAKDKVGLKPAEKKPNFFKRIRNKLKKNKPEIHETDKKKPAN